MLGSYGLGNLTSYFPWDFMSVSGQFLIHFITCSPMITFTFGDLVYNEVEPPHVLQPMGDSRTRWSWSLVTSVKMPLDANVLF